MDDRFKIYIDRLRDDQPESWEGEFSPEFMETEEQELHFRKPVQVKGQAQVTDGELLVTMRLCAKAEIPCSICNEKTEVAIAPETIVHMLPISEVKGAVFNWAPVAREAILLEVPGYAECGGNCPRRPEMERHMKRNDGEAEDKDGYRPFADLQL